MLYIFWFLHQTTTVLVLRLLVSSCISFDSYIKPQHSHLRLRYHCGCISFDSYIKPQLRQEGDSPFCVVYLLIPTSNHNHVYFVIFHNQVVYLLIPTSNHNGSCTGLNRQKLYIFWFLHQTTTYIVVLLFLTVVYLLIPTSNHNLSESMVHRHSVVYLLIPTSNHNLVTLFNIFTMLYIFWFLHQTTT